MFECTYCGNLMEDSDFALITYKGKTYGICPDCLKSLIADSAVRQLSDREEEEIRREWDMEAVYDRQFEEGIR